MLDNAKLFLEKLGTVLADRRFWAAVMPVALTLLGVAGMSDENIQRVKNLVGEDGAALAVFFGSFLSALVALVSSFKLISSWTERPPSGLKYKALVIDQADKKALEDALSFVVNTFYGKPTSTE